MRTWTLKRGSRDFEVIELEPVLGLLERVWERTLKHNPEVRAELRELLEAHGRLKENAPQPRGD